MCVCVCVCACVCVCVSPGVFVGGVYFFLLSPYSKDNPRKKIAANPGKMTSWTQVS